MSRSRLLIATRSTDKLREIGAILDAEGIGLELLDLTTAGVAYTPEEDDIECFATFEENAIAKARYFAARSGLLTLADDSGLCVDALGGAPGVLSKRFSGRTDLAGAALDAENNRVLLERLHDVAAPARTGHYRCVVAIARATDAPRTFAGECAGLVLEAPRGTAGFGYDPLFYVPSEGATLAEISAERKNQISHRAHAVRAASLYLRTFSEDMARA